MSIKLIATGDSLFSSRRLKHRLPEEIVSLFSNSDISFTNAEFTTPRESRSVAAGRGYVTSVRPEILEEFDDLNIRYVSFANNHSGDFGIEGLVDTLEEVKNHNLQPLGRRKSRFHNS